MDHNAKHRSWTVRPSDRDVTEFFLVRNRSVNEYWDGSKWTEYRDFDIIRPHLIVPGVCFMDRP